MSITFQASRVEQVVQKGWRRRLIVLAVAESSLAFSVALGALILLILLGTQILAWPWIAFLTVLGLGWSAFAVNRRIRNAYQVAQAMDESLNFQDSLSSAWFIRTKATGDQPAEQFLLQNAERLAETADPARAFPFERRRAWLVTAALLVGAFSLFTVRYLVTRQLDLERPFLPSVITEVFETAKNPGSATNKPRPTTSDQAENHLPPIAAEQTDKQQDKPANVQGSPQSAAQTPGANKKGEPGEAQDQQAKSSDEPSSTDQQTNGQGKPSDANSKASNGADKTDQQGGKQADSNGPQKSGSLMDRMRDALSSVMAKIKPTGNSANSQKSGQKNLDGQNGADKSGSKDQSGDGQKDAGKEESAQEQSAGQQSQQGAAKAQASQGKDSASPSDKKGSDAQSGVGHSDGSKEMREAEQAKAMGKLAEIIGKRSASLTGEMQIVPSGKQRLQTEYTHAQGQHADLGGEINRDDIPVEDQEYVREYMEMVRKKASSKP